MSPKSLTLLLASEILLVSPIPESVRSTGSQVKMREIRPLLKVYGYQKRSIKKKLPHGNTAATTKPSPAANLYPEILFLGHIGT
jgi:hypothetical protein